MNYKKLAQIFGCITAGLYELALIISAAFHLPIKNSLWAMILLSILFPMLGITLFFVSRHIKDKYPSGSIILLVFAVVMILGIVVLWITM
mgnify:CR=1 FL=1